MHKIHLASALLISFALSLPAFAALDASGPAGDAAAPPAYALPAGAPGASDAGSIRGPQSVARPVFEHNPPRRVAPFPLALNQAVRRYISRFLVQPGSLEASFNRIAPYMAEMVSELENRGLPKDLVYLAFAESEFARDGAGPWQLARSTARHYGLRINRYVDERRDPVKSTRAAAEYLADLHDQIGDWKITLASWNRGEASIDRFWTLRGADYSRILRRLPRCTRSLLNRFMAVAFIARNAETYGVQPIVYSRPPFERIRVRGGMTLTIVARNAGTSVNMIRKLNPALLRDRVPPDVSSYEVWVPRALDLSPHGLDEF